MAVTWTLKIGGSGVSTDRVTLGTLSVDASAASRFTFTEYAKHYAGTWDEGDSVELEYPTSTSRFVGQIAAKRTVGTPGDERVLYECIDRRGLGANVQVRSRGPDESNPNDYPRRIYNAPADDPDQGFNSGASAAETVGEILQDLFDSFDTDLQAESVIGTSPGYVSGDFSALSFVPGKLVLDDLTFEQAVVQVLGQQGPTWRIYIDDSGRWRFYDSQAAASSSTLTLDSDPVIQNQLDRDLRQRYTAVKVYGNRDSGDQIIPNEVGQGTDEAGSSLSGVTELWSGADESNWTRALGAGKTSQGIIASTTTSTFTVSGKTWDTNAWAGGEVIFPSYSYSATYQVLSNTTDTITISGTVPVGSGAGYSMRVSEYGDVFREFQITDTAKRDIVVDAPGEMRDVCCPHVEVIHRNSSGDVVTVQHVDVALLGEGKFRTKIPLFRSPTNGRSPGDSTTFPDWRFVYCYRDTSAASALTARYPGSGFSGDASAAPWSVQRELRLVVDEFQNQTDTATYQSLAQELHKLTSRVLVTGSVTLAGIDWTFRDHRRDVSFDHSVDTTGWASIAAPVSTVTYNLDQNTTTVGFSDDGSGEGVDYGPILARIRQLRELSRAADKVEHSQDYVRCQEAIVARSRAVGVGAELQDQNKAAQVTPDPNDFILIPNGDLTSDGNGVSPENTCKCDEVTTPCRVTKAESYLGGRFICTPDGQHGLLMKHPGGRVDGKFCQDSQLLRYDQYLTGTGRGDTPDGFYFPVLCKGVPIGDHPDHPTRGRTHAECALGFRDLVVVEPETIDGSDEVGIADYVIQLAESYARYIQRNEEAHCCLDNRIACADAGVWGGGVGCFTGSASGEGECTKTIIKGLSDLYNMIEHVAGCVRKIRMGDGDLANCEIPDYEGDFTGCGPC